MIVPLEPTELACRVCGQRILLPNPALVEQLRAFGRERVIAGGIRIVADVNVEFDALRCDSCAHRLATAESLMNTYPQLRMRLGSRPHAVARMEAALIALDVLDVGQKTAGRLLSKERLVHALIDELTTAGHASEWMSRFSPIWAAGADIQTCASAPWAAVDEETMQSLRDGLVKVFGVEMDKPEDFVCPSGTGCLLCGVHSVRALRSAARRGEVWSGIYEVQPGVLGGVRTPDNVRGYMCTPCAEAVERAGGGIGMRAVEEALSHFLGFGAMPADLGLKGVSAWCAVKGAKPNETPWQHEPDHEEIRELIAANSVGVTLSFV
jgi:hypothetical protein